MAGSRSHSRNASQTRSAAGDGDESVLGAVLDVTNTLCLHRYLAMKSIEADPLADTST